MISDPSLYRVKTPELRLAELEHKHLAALMRISTLERWISQLVPRIRSLEEEKERCHAQDDQPRYLGDIGHHRAVPGVRPGAE